MTKLIVIENEVVEVETINNYGVTYLECNNGCEYIIFETREEAGEAARERWQEMKDNDKSEFRCIIGDERLVQWACGESDSFGISSFNEFLDVVETVPEEEFAGYDGNETDVKQMNKNLKNELNFGSCENVVIYRHN